MLLPSLASLSSAVAPFAPYLFALLVVLPAQPCHLRAVFVSETVASLFFTLATVGLLVPSSGWLSPHTCHAIATASSVLGVLVTHHVFPTSDVNPAITVTKFMLDKITYANCFWKLCGQILGSLAAFVVAGSISSAVLCVPRMSPHIRTCFVNEFIATTVLCLVLCALTYNSDDVIVLRRKKAKAFVFASTIRLLGFAFPESGPSMNPMIALSYAKIKRGSITNEELFVYGWAAVVASVAASVAFATYSGDKVLGMQLSRDRVVSGRESSKSK
jgi:glycerol uptake facilitator-like aquaporin